MFKLVWGLCSTSQSLYCTKGHDDLKERLSPLASRVFRRHFGKHCLVTHFSYLKANHAKKKNYPL